MAQFFEILMNKEKLKQSIREVKKNFVDMFKDVRREARAAGEEMRKAAASANTAKDNRYFNQTNDFRRKQRNFRFPTAQRDIFNQALREGFLRPSDFKGKGSLANLTKQWRTGIFDKAFKEFMSTKNSPIQATKIPEVKTKISLLNRFSNAWKKVADSVKGYHKKLSEGEKFERGYFTRLRHQLISLATYYVSYRAAKNAAIGIFNAGKSKEENYFQLSTPFGNKGNVKDAYEMAQRKALSGKVPFKKQDMIDAFTEMMEIGLDPRNNKNFNLMGNIAGAKGMNMADVTKDISSAVYGNSDILRKYGINNRQIFALDRMVNQRPDNRRNAIMQMLSGDKRWENGMRDFAYSWKGMLNTMGNHWKFFLESIIGDPSDKNSLYSKIKDAFQLLINWFNKNQKRIQRFGIAIGEVLKWTLRQVVAVGRWMGGWFEKILKKTDGTTADFRTKMMKMVLWLELSKEKVVRFFDKWGWAIKTLVGIWASSKIVGLMGKGIATILAPINTVIKALRIMGALLGVNGTIATGMRGLLPLLGRLTAVTAAVTAAYWLLDNNRPKNPTPGGAGGKGDITSLPKNPVDAMNMKNFNKPKSTGNPLFDNDIADVAKLIEKQRAALSDQLQNGVINAPGIANFLGRDRKTIKSYGNIADRNKLQNEVNERAAIIINNLTLKANNPKEFQQELQKINQQFGNQSGYSGAGTAMDIWSDSTTNF